MNFSEQSIQQGRMNQRAGEETPGSFAEVNGASEVNSTKDLSKNPRRMAGEMGGRAMALLNDPIEQQRTATWMQQFGLSNQGAEFNQAKMMMAQPQQPVQ